jgi:hypothetical protein
LGKIGSGKDYVAKLLKKYIIKEAMEVGVDIGECAIVAFTDMLKVVTCSNTKTMHPSVIGNLHRPKDNEYRLLLQKNGLKMREEVDEDYWVKAAAAPGHSHAGERMWCVHLPQCTLQERGRCLQGPWQGEEGHALGSA